MRRSRFGRRKARPVEPERPRRLPWYAALPIAAVSGLLLDLAFPSTGWWPLAFVSIAGALWTLVGRSAGGAFLTGLAYGATFYFTHLIWVVQFLGALPWVALAGLEALLFAAGAIPIALAYRWTSRSRSRTVRALLIPALVAGLWTTRELAMGSWPYSGFPWARIGMSQANGPFAEAASWVGVSGLTFLIVCLCAALVQWARAASLRSPTGLITAAVIAALLSVPAFPTTDAGSLRVGWVQGDGPAGYFDDRGPGDVLAAQSEATEPLSGKRMDLLVWPEGGVDSDPLANQATARWLDALVASVGAPLLMNAATARGQDVFNTSMLWEGGGATQLHDKVNPVPFGEYVPDRWFYEKIVPDLINLIQREYTPGTNPPFMTVGGIGVGLAICFDVIYDTVIWDGAKAGAQFYAFQTNNADFRGTDENLQQLEFARMRAIETGRAVVNVSTVGTSQVIAPDGSVIEGAAADRQAAAVTTVPLRTGLTPAVLVGPVLAILIPVAALGGLLAAGILRRRARRSDPAQPIRSSARKAQADPEPLQEES
ncbi:apolipoprotein N-acyltransferase [Leucobacter sp. wl10]|uniref:apolipoprotein N-acyltransferase n=1 Tax=Leucobacter sp. wl10 TaxID=2304677 RepID=UPI000E5A7BA6|nr:apolipoprotein N-acyltransferase [Leucobacter sp. wl10]RGE21597.1 apolipoprotein N-acyltransferase [Leucobacter sp. wl10]